MKAARIMIAMFAFAAGALLTHRAYVVLVRYHAYDDRIREASLPRGLDPPFVSALIWRESRFDASRRGKAGEIGLMQVRPDAAYEWARAHRSPAPGAGELLDPSTNLAVGTWYLARAVERWSGRADPLPYALAEYNAGRSNALRWAAAANTNDARAFEAAITYGATRRYVREILHRYRGDR